MKMLTIVPRLPPAVCGVGETSLALATAMKARNGIDTAFVTGDIHARTPNVAGWDAEALGTRSASRLLRELDGSSMALLHFAGYGYAARGCPFWLASALEEWTRDESNRLAVIFHELYADGPVWTSAFWVSPAQRSIARRIARAATLSIATRTVIASEVSSWLPQGIVRHLPIVSTAGETTNPLPLQQRERRIVIFGGPGTRARAYAHCDQLDHVCRTLGVDEIVDIGPPLEGVYAPDSVRFTRMGILEPGQVAAILSESLGGFIAYHDGCLAKSSILAAYAAHGVLPITSEDHHSESDGLIAGKHYLPASQLRDSEQQPVADAIHSWYRGHALSVYADTIAESLTS